MLAGSSGNQVSGLARVSEPMTGGLGHGEQHCAEMVGGGGDGWPRGRDTRKTSSLAKSYFGPCSAVLYGGRLPERTGCWGPRSAPSVGRQCCHGTCFRLAEA